MLHPTAKPEHEQWGATIGGSRWFRDEPEVSDGKWMCPVPDCGGVMTDTGWQWPMYPPGRHHTCSNELCGFTAALNERDMEEHGIEIRRWHAPAALEIVKEGAGGTMSEIKPAMTPGEWADVMGWRAAWGETAVVEAIRAAVDLADPTKPQIRALLAALCLHEQPFGFTREDVEGLRRAVRRSEAYDTMYGPTPSDDREWWSSLADRIEALLPPEGL